MPPVPLELDWYRQDLPEIAYSGSWSLTVKEKDLKDKQKGDLDLFHNSIFTGLTIGIPFCFFKFLFGRLFLRNHIAILGWIIIIWAMIDLLMNVAYIIQDILHLEPFIEPCIISQLGRLIFNRATLFLAFDTFLSFGIICFTLWSGWIKELYPIESYLWYGATTVNLLSLSIVNIWGEFRKKSDEEKILSKK